VNIPESCLSVLAVTLLAARVHGSVEASEFSSFPTVEGWEIDVQEGDMSTWVVQGYYQDFPNNCPPGGVCVTQAWTRSIATFNGQARWFFEYRAAATGSHTEIQAGAPTVLAAFNAFGNLYHATLAADRIKLSGDADLPILFYEVEPGVPHTIRLELYNEPPPATFGTSTLFWFLKAWPTARFLTSTRASPGKVEPGCNRHSTPGFTLGPGISRWMPPATSIPTVRPIRLTIFISPNAWSAAPRANRPSQAAPGPISTPTIPSTAPIGTPSAPPGRAPNPRRL